MIRCLFAALLCAASIHAAGIPEGGRNVLPSDWQTAAQARGSSKLWKTEMADFGEHGKGWCVEVLDDKANPNQLQLTCVLEGEVKSGARMLLTFEARCVSCSSSGDKGRARAVVEIKDPPTYTKLGEDEFDVTSDWQTVNLPFPANANSKPSLTHATIMPGGKKQTLEIANLRLLDYGPDFDLGKLPRPYIHYPGREEGAPWRKAALERIEKLRTTEIAVEVVDATGKPVPNAKVNVELKRHAFAFGTAVKAKYLAGTDEQSQRYREIIDQNFSAIVLENDLKPFGWEGGASNDGREYRRDWTIAAMSWAKKRGMRVRGHYLAWGPWESWSEKLKDQPSAIRDKVMLHLLEVTHATSGLADEWDVVNHPVGWSSPRATVDQVIGPDFYADVIKTARGCTSVPLFVNEDQVFRPGRQQEEFYDCIQDLIARGAKPDGIGNQAHFHSSFLPAPEEMLRISDRFAALVPNLELTEFDVTSNGDEQLQADWLRDVLIMAYSHPAYSGVMLWVFWEGAGWKPECALWRKDWSEKPNAKTWRQLVCDTWKTGAGGLTGQDGVFNARGHRGLYKVTVEIDSRTKMARYSTESGTGRVKVVW